MNAFDWQLQKKGCIPLSGQIVDASLVPAPKPGNTESEREAIKSGKSAKDIGPDEPNKAARRTSCALDAQGMLVHHAHVGLQAPWMNAEAVFHVCNEKKSGTGWDKCPATSLPMLHSHRVCMNSSLLLHVVSRVRSFASFLVVAHALPVSRGFATAAGCERFCWDWRLFAESS